MEDWAELAVLFAVTCETLFDVLVYVIVFPEPITVPPSVDQVTPLVEPVTVAVIFTLAPGRMLTLAGEIDTVTADVDAAGAPSLLSAAAGASNELHPASTTTVAACRAA